MYVRVCVYALNRLLSSRVSFLVFHFVQSLFVRALPETTVHTLRDEIETQLGFDIVPRDYFFLKSVGRCLAQVT